MNAPFRLLIHMIITCFIFTGCTGKNQHAISYASVIFEDNFDSHADWRPRSTSGYVVCDYGEDCTTKLPPIGWTHFRSAELWPGPTNQDTVRITNQADRNGSGKAFIVYNESNKGASGDGWGADGQLTKLLDKDYQEIYVRVWVRTQAGWKWPSESDMMIKMIQLYHFDRKGSIYNAFTGGVLAPIYVMDFKHSPKWGTRYMNSLRCDPQETDYYCLTSVPLDALFVPGDYKIEPTGAGMMADGHWHRLDFHLRMNTFNGHIPNSDGIYEFSYDGKLKESHSNVQWKRIGSNSSIGWNVISLGGNAYNQYAGETDKAEQWYALDDIVVSTTIIPDNYVISGVVSAKTF